MESTQMAEFRFQAYIPLFVISYQFYALLEPSPEPSQDGQKSINREICLYLTINSSFVFNEA